MDARVKTDRMMTAGEGRPEFSVVSPVRNEAENVDALVREIAAALSGRAFEIIFVDDASQDDTRARLHALIIHFEERHPAVSAARSSLMAPVFSRK